MRAIASGRASRAVLLAAILAGAPLTAFADEPTSSPASEGASPSRPPAAEGGAQGATPAQAPSASLRMESHWYGWQTLLVDGGSILTCPLIVGCLGYVIGGPIVHVVHRRPGIAAASIGLRLGLPPAFALAGYGIGSGIFGPYKYKCSGFFMCGPPAVGALIGFGLGIVTAITLDAAWLARETVPAKRKDSAHLIPSISPRLEGGVDVGLAGTF